MQGMIDRKGFSRLWPSREVSCMKPFFFCAGAVRGLCDIAMIIPGDTRHFANTLGRARTPRHTSTTRLLDHSTTRREGSVLFVGCIAVFIRACDTLVVERTSREVGEEEDKRTSEGRKAKVGKKESAAVVLFLEKSKNAAPYSQHASFERQGE